MAIDTSRYSFPLNRVAPFLENDLSVLGADALANVGVSTFALNELDDTVIIGASLDLGNGVALAVPGQPAFEFVLDAIDQSSGADLVLQVYPEANLEISNLNLGICFPSSLFKPVNRQSDGTFTPIPAVGGKPARLKIEVKNARFSVGGERGIDLGLLDESVPLMFNHPFMIGDSGVVVDAKEIGLYFTEGSSPPGMPAGSVGVGIPKATVYLPSGLSDLLPKDLTITDAFIGSGGFTGKFGGDWTPKYDKTEKTYLGNGAGSLFGLSFGLKKVEIGFQQSALTKAEIKGGIALPFFEQGLDVDVGFDLNGNISITVDKPGGILDFTYSANQIDIFKVTMDGLGFQREGDKCRICISGEIEPLVGGLQWPKFRVDNLSIDSEGNVHLEGGWLNLLKQYSLDFYGFKVEITKLGFGKTEDGGKWIGFSGSVKLVDGLPAGASVEGLRIIWYDDNRSPRITLNGIGVEFEVPGALRFKGAVSYRELPGGVSRFDGDIKLELITLDMVLDAKLVIGTADGDQGKYSFFAIYLGLELPAGIPLWCTGLALYGMAGLFALQMTPDKKDDEAWYAVDQGKSWYHRDPLGVTGLTKWTNKPDMYALGAGVTIGTVADNGYAFSGRMLLAIILSGPTIVIEGRANILRKRSDLESEPLFRAMVVLDGRAGTFLAGLDAQYKFASGGELLEIGGSAEVLFSFTDPSLWHIYLGLKEPRDKRIRARIFKLFESNSYWMLDANQLAFGSWVGYGNSWKFGPVRITLEASMETNVAVGWYPPHFHGDLWLHGKAELKIWWFGFGLGVTAGIAGDIFDPFHLLAELSVEVDLPWPLPDFSFGLTLEWGPQKDRPSLPLPLKEITIEHPKVTTSWPLPRGSLLLPDYEGSTQGLRQEPSKDPMQVAVEPPPEFSLIPVVPLDCRPQITFARPINDDAQVGVNLQPVLPAAKPESGWEWIGDPTKDQNQGPARVHYALKEVSLYKYEGNTWVQMATKCDIPNSNIGDLYGAWAPVPNTGGDGVAQTKLLVWSKTPFDFTRHGGSSWDEWFTEHYPNYPCIPIPPDQEICYDFERVDPGAELTLPWPHPEQPELVFQWDDPSIHKVSIFQHPTQKQHHALCFPLKDGPVELSICLPQPAKKVKVIVVSEPGVDITAFSIDGKPIGPAVHGGYWSLPIVEVIGSNIKLLKVQGRGMCIIAVCITVGLDDTEKTRRQEMNKHLLDETARWSQTGNLLEPNTTYRLTIATEIHVKGEKELEGWDEKLIQTEYAYFRTDGPPGFARLSIPVGTQSVKEVAARNPQGRIIAVDQDGKVRELSLEETHDIDKGKKELSNCLKPNERAVLKGDLNDLKLYVQQTMPASVPAKGQQPPLPRPVYRAYDVEVEFNEEYVDLMYRLYHRGLGLYLYDNNNQPVRDAAGKLIVLSNRWGKVEDLKLTRSEERWITVANSSSCMQIDLPPIPHNETLTSAAEGQVLDPDTVYEARLVPLLLQEGFSKELIDWDRFADNKNYMLLGGPPQWVGHTTLKGEKAAVNGSVVSLDGSPDLTELNPDLDIILLDKDTARASGRYMIKSVENASKTVTVDGAPNLDGGTSTWVIPEAVVQTSNVGAGSTFADDPKKPGTMLLRKQNPSLPPSHDDQPANWTAYRLSVYVRSAADGAIGIVFRYFNSGYYYRFSMDRQLKYRRLIRVAGGIHTILAEDDFVYQTNRDYLISVEAVGASLRVYQDGALAFDVTDASMPQGSIGLYCWKNAGVCFSSLRIDDFRQAAPIVYRFKFTTSNFANFFHLIHSFQDEIWPMSLEAGVADDAELTAIVGVGAKLDTRPSETEARAYETLAGHVLGQTAQQNPPGVQITRVERNNATFGFLLQSPEPIDWQRTTLDVLQSQALLPPPRLPGIVKMTDVSMGASQPNEESVTLLLRDKTDLTGYRIEHLSPPGPIAEPETDPIIMRDDFIGRDSGLLFRETFGPNALDHYSAVEQGTELGPADWKVSGDHIVQVSPVFGGSISPSDPAKPGTIRITGSPEWSNVLIRTTLRSEANGALGVVFRNRDASNYYRFSMDCQHGYRRLIRMSPGPYMVAGMLDLKGKVPIPVGKTIKYSNVDILWQDDAALKLGHSYHLTIIAYEDRLLGYLDGALLFNIRDAAIPAGQAGFYCCANPGAHFEALEVEALESDPVLWQPAFTDTSEISIVDEQGAIKGPSKWKAEKGLLSQLSAIQSKSSNSALQPGTYAAGGSRNWRDIAISVRLHSNDSGPIGVMFRCQDNDHYYRFSLGNHRNKGFGHCGRRLIKRVGNNVTVLWQDAGKYLARQSCELTLRAVGSEISGIMDGVPLFVIHDGDMKNGQVAFYSWANQDACFEHVLVTDCTRQVGRWIIYDEGDVNAPSVWRMTKGALIQRSKICGAAPDSLGTYVVAGDPGWSDYRLSASIRSDANASVGVMVRFVDSDNYYRLSLDPQTAICQLVRKRNGKVTVLKNKAKSYQVGEQFKVDVDAIGSRFVCYLDGEQLFEVSDNAHSSGRIGLCCSENDSVRFEWVEVRRPPLDAFAMLRDHFADGDKSGWAFVDEGTSGTSKWVIKNGALCQTLAVYSLPQGQGDLSKPGTYATSGDLAWKDVIIKARLRSSGNDAIGLMFRYQDGQNYYRFSMARQLPYLYLVKNIGGTFQELWSDKQFVLDVKHTYEVTIICIGTTLRGYLDGVPMFVVQDRSRGSGAIGLYGHDNIDMQFSQVRVYPAELRFDHWLLDEPFNNLEPERWAFVSDGSQQGPAHWELIRSELRQTSHIYGGTMDNSEFGKPGTYAVTGDVDWSDYRATVCLRSNDAHAIGMMFRYIDSDNYYRFSMDRELGYRMLIKKIKGVVTRLWHDNKRYALGRTYVLTVDCIGSELVGYLDGVRIFACTDNDLHNGCVALYCWANNRARFSEVRVAPLTWMPYYTFVREERLPAGSRVRLLAGNEKQAPAPPKEAGIIHRFIAPLNDPGEIQLPATGADLRLIDPSGEVGHARRFLPESSYESANTTITLRKADGTGLFLLMPSASPSGSTFEAMQYRLKLKYLRDNLTVEPDSQVLRQAGDKGPEQVVIDLPIY